MTTPITRRTVSAALAALAVTVLAACGTDTASPRAATDPVTVTALSGAPVTVPSGTSRKPLAWARVSTSSCTKFMDCDLSARGEVMR